MPPIGLLEVSSVLTCHIDDFVCVYPRLPADGVEEREDADAESTLFWLARISGLRHSRRNPHAPVLVRLQWFYTRHDIKNWMNYQKLNEDTRIVLADMGRKEVVYSNHYDILEADVIERCIDVIPFPMNPELNALAHANVWYWRGFALNIERDEVKIRFSAPKICWEEHCHFDQRYRPDHHTIRYCDWCHVWAHTACCAPWDDDLSNHAPYTDALLDAAVPAEAKQVFMCPLIRDPWFRARWWGLEAAIIYTRTMVEEYPKVFRVPHWKTLWNENMVAELKTRGSKLHQESLQDELQPILDAYIARHVTAPKYSCRECGRWM
ncbi:hypothetical protein EVJ58_g5806 [Rhodofomes roseus]|uniref:BAH domain-containing protein n=1 Tax=Rhodofomes roseus TaxID=34475 RepID=A0A4Y9YBH9_9APHY|nr:hypothetical protein EVJ58_g5806 [Rhodofomes roseus]